MLAALENLWNWGVQYTTRLRDIFIFIILGVCRGVSVRSHTSYTEACKYCIKTWVIGSTKFLIHPSVCPFVQTLSLEPLISNFQIFWMRLGCHLKLKSDRANFFEKILFSILGQKGPKMRFLKFSEKSVCGIFDFLQKVTATHWKLTYMIFLVKKLFWCFQVKRGQNGSKKRFFKFYEKLVLLIFLHKATVAYRINDSVSIVDFEQVNISWANYMCCSSMNLVWQRFNRHLV